MDLVGDKVRELEAVKVQIPLSVKSLTCSGYSFS